MPSDARTSHAYAPATSAPLVQDTVLPEATKPVVPELMTVDPWTTWNFNCTGSPSGSTAEAENVGVAEEQTYTVKKVNLDYFGEE